MMTKTADQTIAEIQDGVEHKIDLAAGRRAFMRHVGLATAGAGLLATPGLLGGAQAQTPPANMDVAILNFALNLEYLEAEFYLHATTGSGLQAADTGPGANSSTTTGEVLAGGQVPFSNPQVADYAAEIADDEQKHVRFLRSALGSSAVARPKINVKGAFAKAAEAAGLGTGFDAYASDVNFLLGAYIFEDVGVTAYHGAAALVTDKNILTAAAGILAVEAYHAGLIRTTLFAMGVFGPTRKISELRASLSGADDDQGVSAMQGAKYGGPQTCNIVPTDTNAIAFARTSRQVLNIVYGQANATMGLFFPNGTNQ